MQPVSSGSSRAEGSGRGAPAGSRAAAGVPGADAAAVSGAGATGHIDVPASWVDAQSRIRARLPGVAGAIDHGQPVRGVRAGGSGDDGPSDPFTLYVLGEPDSGKSTFARWLADSLAGTVPVALLDADPGQGTIGPPTTIGARLWDRRGDAGTPVATAADRFAPEAAGLPSSPERLYFIGDTTPVGSLMQLITGLAALRRAVAEWHPSILIVDPCGLVSGAVGREMQLHSMEVLRTDEVVLLGEVPSENGVAAALDRRHVVGGSARGRGGRSGTVGGSSGSTGSGAGGSGGGTGPSPIGPLRVDVPAAAHSRSTAERRDRRQGSLESYFAGARTWSLPLARLAVRGFVPAPGGVRRLAVGICDPRGYLLALGSAVSASRGDAPTSGEALWSGGLGEGGATLRLLSPPVEPEAPAEVRFGKERIPPLRLRRE